MKALTRNRWNPFATTASCFPFPPCRQPKSRPAWPGSAGWRRNLGRPSPTRTRNGGRTATCTRPGSIDLIRHPRILDAIEDIIGPDILVWTSTFFIKEPHSPTYAAWHQDGGYFGLEPKHRFAPGSP